MQSTLSFGRWMSDIERLHTMVMGGWITTKRLTASVVFFIINVSDTSCRPDQCRFLWCIGDCRRVSGQLESIQYWPKPENRPSAQWKADGQELMTVLLGPVRQRFLDWLYAFSHFQAPFIYITHHGVKFSYNETILHRRQEETHTVPCNPLLQNETFILD